MGRMRLFKKSIACMMVATLLVGLTGCSGNSEQKPKPSEAAKASESKAESKTENSTTASEGITYPLKTDETLKIAIMVEGAVREVSKDYSETPFWKTWSEKTGVKLEMVSITDGAAMALMFADGDLPDIVKWSSDGYSGGVSKGIKDKAIEPISQEELIKFCPNLNKVLENDVYRNAITVNGKIVGFPFIRGDRYLLTAGGLVCRADWLKELNMEVPETLDEFTEVLRAFKERKGADVPLSAGQWWIMNLLEWGIITSAFGLPKGVVYQKDNKVHCGYAEPEYKDALAYLNMLYEERLLDPNFSTLDQSTSDTNLYEGKAGVTLNSVGGGMGTYLRAMEETNPDFDLIAIPSLVAKKGDKAMSGNIEFPVTTQLVWITPQCKNKELAMKFMDFGYSEEGGLFFNYGVEGESYTMKNGVPTYTDIVNKNEKGLTMQQALAQYCRSWSSGPFVQQKEYMEQYASRPQQKDAINTWMNTAALDYLLPPISISENSLAEYNRLSADIKTYVEEKRLRFIMGEDSMDTFESEYLEKLKQLGIERFIEIQQQALDEYNKK